jgi:hypothetical protein
MRKKINKRYAYWRKSKCIAGYIHKFDIQREFENGCEEKCDRCNIIIFFPIHNGQIDNENYLDYHMRSALPPYHPLFFHEYQYQST